MMQLSPLQSRLAASLVASVSLLVLYLFLLSPSLAQAAELDEGLTVVLDENDLELPVSDRSSLDPDYQPQFSLFGRSIIGRAPPGVTGLLDNVRENRNVLPGTVQPFVFEATRIWPGSNGVSDVTPVRPRGFNETWGPSLMGAEELDVSKVSEKKDNELRRRQQMSKMVYISATACLQPQRRPNNTENDPPQLTLFISTTPENQTPGPDKPMSQQEFRPFDEGAVTWKVNATGDVFFGISAPTTHAGWFDGSWNFDVAVSTDEFYHTYDESPSAVLWVESDSTAALLQTPNLTDTSDYNTVQQVMSAGPQYVMFVENQKGWATRGVRHSMCGLSNYALMAAKTSGQFGDKATTVMTTRGPGGLPKQQFHFNGLNASSSYWGILAHVGTSTSRKRQFENRAGGGGQVFQAIQFETKTGDNCKIVTDLSFCNETEYAVPANDDRMNITALARFYDDYAREMYDNFKKQLAQVACDVPAEQRYSLVRNCSDCEESYKKWLCSVTIPRCEDFSAGANSSFVRNVGQPFPNGTLLPESVRDQFNGTAHNKSRLARIDEDIAPGPYREILPCEDLCYDLVRDCPASLAFSCPKKSHGERFEASYQVRGPGLTCNYPGAVRNPSAASGLAVSWILLMAVVSVCLCFLS